MGTWGTKIGSNDTFCETQEMFKKLMTNNGLSPKEAAEEVIQMNCDNADIVNVYYAVADALWHYNELNDDLLNIVEKFLENDLENWKELGADEEMLAQRERSIKAFRQRLSKKAKNNAVWHIIKQASDLPKKGDVFWYRKKGCMYVCLVVDIIECDYYLIGISQELPCIPDDVQTALETPLYTAAWFDELSVLKSKYRHKIGSLQIDGDYNGRCGMLIDDGGISCRNVGQSATWLHDYKAFNLPQRKLSALLDPQALPKTHKEL